MKIEIRVGDYTQKRVKFAGEKKDNFERDRMYEFLKSQSDCTIEDVDMFLLYALNNCITAFIVKDNSEIDVEADDADYALIPKLNPSDYQIFEISDRGIESCIQGDSGSIAKNYFNELMRDIMDDYYLCLQFYTAEENE